MTVRPHIVLDPADAPRPSARVARVAAILDCDPSDVRRMLRAGELEGHGKGIRGKRVYLDSVAAYQRARDIEPQRKNGHEIRRKRVAVSKARTARSLAILRQAGIIP